MLLHPIFASLTPADRAAVEARVRVLPVLQGQVLVNAGQTVASVFIVVAGKLRVETSSDDKPGALTGFLQAEDIYVESLTGPDYVASNTLRGALASTIHAIPLGVLHSLVMQYPEIGPALVQAAVERSLKLRRQLRRLKVEPVRTQVARAVYDAGHTANDGQRVLDRRITQSDLAQVTGLSREAVNKGMRQLSDASLLRKSDRGLEIDKNFISTNYQPWDEN